MNQNSSKSDALRLPLMILTAAGSAASSLEQVRNFFGAESEAWQAVPFIIGAVAFIWCVYLLFTRRQVESRLVTPEKSHLRVWRYSTVERATAATVATLIVLWFGISTITAKIEPKNIVFLVANFDGPDSDYGVTQSLIAELRNATKGHTDVQIDALGKTISEQEGAAVARKIGKKRRASVVLWGRYRKTSDKVNLVIHFEVLRKPESLQLIQDQKAYTVPVASLESFTLHQELAADVNFFALFAAGVARFEGSDYRGAIPYFSEALKFRTNGSTTVEPGDIYFFRGSCYGQIHELDRSIDDLLLATKLSTNSAGALGNLAVSYFAKRDLTNALKNFDAALMIRQDAIGYQNRGMVHHLLGNTELAFADYGRAISLNTKESGIFNNRGILFTARGRFDDAIRDYDRAIKLAPTNEAPYMNRGVAYFKKGQFKRAIVDHTRAINLAPTKAVPFAERALCRASVGDTNGAIADYQRAIELDPTQPQPYVALADIYVHRNEPRLALPNYTRGLEISTNWGEVFGLRGAAFMLLGDNDRAIADMSKALTLQFTNSAIFNNRGLVYAAKGQFADAVRDHSQSIALEPNIGESYFNRALAFQRLGQLSNALADVNSGLRLTNLLAMHLLRSELLLGTRDFEAAVQSCRDTIGKYPDSAQAYFRLAESYFAQGQFSKALAAYDEAIRFDPMLAEAFHNRGNAYSIIDDLEKARQSFQRAMQLTTNPVIRASASNSLHRLGPK
jgi:tetratricopeptide (TPR) repeat protein